MLQPDQDAQSSIWPPPPAPHRPTNNPATSGHPKAIRQLSDLDPASTQNGIVIDLPMKDPVIQFGRSKPPILPPITCTSWQTHPLDGLCLSLSRQRPRTPGDALPCNPSRQRHGLTRHQLPRSHCPTLAARARSHAESCRNLWKPQPKVPRKTR